MAKKLRCPPAPCVAGARRGMLLGGARLGGTGARREAERGGRGWGRGARLAAEEAFPALGLLQRSSRGAGRLRPGAPQHGLTLFWWETSQAALLGVVSCPGGRVGAGQTQPCMGADPAHSPAGDPAAAPGAAGTGKGNAARNAHPPGEPPAGPRPLLPVAARAALPLMATSCWWLLNGERLRQIIKLKAIG